MLAFAGKMKAFIDFITDINWVAFAIIFSFGGYCARAEEKTFKEHFSKFLGFICGLIAVLFLMYMTKRFFT